MTFTIGRVGLDGSLDEPSSMRDRGGAVQFSGFARASTLAKTRALRDQLVSMQGDVVAVTSVADPTIDGWYQILSAEVDQDVKYAPTVRRGLVPWKVSAVHLGGANDREWETIRVGASGEAHVQSAPPVGAYSYSTASYRGLKLDGTGDCAVAASSAGYKVTGDIDIRVHVAATDWTPSTDEDLIGKWEPGTNKRSYKLRLESAGTLTLFWSEDGTAELSVTSSAATGFTDGTAHWLRATLDVNGGAGGVGRVTFYTGTDGETWSQLGTTGDAGSAPTSIHSNTSDLAVGAQDNAGANGFTGTVLYSTIFNGIQGDAGVYVVHDVSFCDYNGVSAGPTAVNENGLAGGTTLLTLVGNAYFVAGNPYYSVTRASSDGNIVTYIDPSYASNPRWFVTPANWVKGRARILTPDQDGALNERTGSTIPTVDVTNWALHNGVVRATPSTAVAGALALEAWDGSSAWEGKYVLRFQRDDVNVEQWESMSILRNTNEVSIIRLHGASTAGRETLDLAVTRGSRYVRGYWLSYSTTATLDAQPFTVDTKTGALGNRWGVGALSPTGVSVQSSTTIDGHSVALIVRQGSASTAAPMKISNTDDELLFAAGHVYNSTALGSRYDHLDYLHWDFVARTVERDRARRP